METTINNKVYTDQKMWFSMWFLGAIVSFGAAFFPMFYRLIESRNKHRHKDVEFELNIMRYLESIGRETPTRNEQFKLMNSKLWAASIILVIPAFVIVYLLSRDLIDHERNLDSFLSSTLPERVFMPQTIPIKTYAVITIITLGVGIVYWLYKIVNLYNAHYKAHSYADKEIDRLMEEKQI